MAYRPQLDPYKVIDNGDMSADIVSKVTIVQKISMISYAFSWSGSSPLGSISVEVSNDYALEANGSVKNAGTWSTMTVQLNGSAVSSIPVSGNSGNGFIDIDQTAAYAMRVRYTADGVSPGTGTLQCTMAGKVA